jgi:hypothetical protein
MAVFEVVVESPGSRISLGPFLVYKGSIILLVIPIFVSYMLFQYLSDSRRISASSSVFSELFALWSTKAESNDLDVFLYPSFLVASDPTTAGYPQNQSIGDRIYFFMSLIFEALISIGVLAFAAQAYYVLYLPPLGRHLLWLISVILTTFFCLVSLVYNVVTIRVGT